MQTSDAVKLVLGAVAVLLLGRLFVGALFASVAVGAYGPRQSLVVLLPVLVAAGGAALLVVLVVARSLDDEDDAVAELRKAYARGNIDEEEFERRRERLTQR